MSAIFNYDTYKNSISTLRERYNNAQEFSHIVIDNFLVEETAEKIYDSFPRITDPGWIHYFHINEKKYGLNKIELLPISIRQTIEELNSETFLAFLRDVTGIPNLIPDKSLEGGGVHQTARGGFLNMHADFTAHPHYKNWRRRVNILIYFNKDWEENYGGHLELWDRRMQSCFEKIPPLFNRCVIFSTDKDAYHGHPHPLNCPEGMTRKSIALYYFTEENNPLSRATNYRHIPGDGLMKRLLIFLDKKVLSTYNNLKRTFGISDDFASFCLKLISKIQK